MSNLMTRVHIKWMIRRDMPEVIGIEHSSFDYPWCEEEFLRVLRKRNCIGMVAEFGERVVGFMVYELHKPSLRVLNLAVHPEFRRQGIGRQMSEKLIGKLSAHRRARIDVDIRETNTPGILFLSACGFVATGVAREHFEDTGEDAYLFEYRLDGSEVAA